MSAHQTSLTRNETRFLSLSIPILVAAATLIMGIVPFVILAIRSGTFWFTENCDVPLMAVPSVWLGDSVFLPLLNYRICRYFASLIHDRDSAPNRFTWQGIAVAVAVSAVVNSYVHYQWTLDAYTGFVDVTPGLLAPVGWWHCAFSTLQSAFILIFLFFWLRSSRATRGQDHAARGFSVWRVFIWYSTLSILDFAVSHLVVLPRRPDVPHSPLTNWQGLLVPLLSVGTYLLARAMQARRLRS